jgi:hypothetical protein
MKGSLVRLPLRHTWRHRTDHHLLHFHATFVMMPRVPPIVAPSLVLWQNWETLTRPALRRSKLLDVDTCPHTVFICSSVLRRKPTNLLQLGFEAQSKKLLWWFCGPNHKTVDLGFEAQTKKSSKWFWGQATEKPPPLVFRLNQETHTYRLLHVYIAGHTRHHVTSWSYGHRLPDLCLIIPNPPHQVSYSCLNHHRCPPCHIRHLHITRQANVFLLTE